MGIRTGYRTGASGRNGHIIRHQLDRSKTSATGARRTLYWCEYSTVLTRRHGMYVRHDTNKIQYPSMGMRCLSYQKTQAPYYNMYSYLPTRIAAAYYYGVLKWWSAGAKALQAQQASGLIGGYPFSTKKRCHLQERALAQDRGLESPPGIVGPLSTSN